LGDNSKAYGDNSKGKAMEIEHIRIKRLNLKKEKAYAIG